MLDKKSAYELLDRYHFIYEAYEHAPVYTIEEMDALNLPHKEEIVKISFCVMTRRETII